MTHKAFANERGFTLAELLIACAILAFIMAGLFTIQQSGQTAYLIGSSRVEVQQNARIALDSMMNDLRGALPVAGSNQVITAIDANCATAGTGGQSISFNDASNTAVAYSLVSGELRRNGTPVIGGVEVLRIFCYNGSDVLNSALAGIRVVQVQIQTRTERGPGSGPTNQHAFAEARVRLRNVN